MNTYKVSYKRPGPGVKFNAETLCSHLWDHLNVALIEAIDFPFNTTDWEGYWPTKNIRTEAGSCNQNAIISFVGWSQINSQPCWEIGMCVCVKVRGQLCGVISLPPPSYRFGLETQGNDSKIQNIDVCKCKGYLECEYICTLGLFLIRFLKPCTVDV